MPPFARLRDVVPSAYLRVFQPLDGFERQEQIHWERYLIEGARSTTLGGGTRTTRRPRGWACSRRPRGSTPRSG